MAPRNINNQIRGTSFPKRNCGSLKELLSFRNYATLINAHGQNHLESTNQGGIFCLSKLTFRNQNPPADA